MTELTEEQRGVLEKVEKLLRLAGKNTSEAEASSAMAKAQELLAVYNLSMDLVEREADPNKAREQQRLAGGAYEWQRQLWHAVAELNFCLHFVRRQWTRRENGTGKERWRHRHVVVGRRVNVAATKIMVEYIEQACERLVDERFPGNRREHWTQDVMAYREGIVDRVVQRVYERREQALSEERERIKREVEAAAGRVSTSQALTLASMTKREEDANNDFLHGEGWTARVAAQRAEEARAKKEADEAHAAWAAAHPEEARAEEERRRKEREAYWKRRRGRAYRETGAERRANSGIYHQGWKKGDEVGIDPQVDTPKSRRIG